MATNEPTLISGRLGLPRPVPGTGARFEATATLDSGSVRRVVWDRRTRLATVYDESDQLLGWTEHGGRGVRQVVLADGQRPPVSFQDRLLSRRVWIDGVKLKPVMMLEGRKRIFGTARISLEHRDFTSEVRFRCAPELEVAAILVAFEVYGAGSCQSE